MIFEISRYSLLVLGTLIVLGGIMGYKKAKSKASLIAGIASCVLLDVSFALSFVAPIVGLIAGFVVLACLDIVFLLRLLKTRVIMPAGALLLLCIFGQVLLAFGMLNFQQTLPGVQ
jgi:uncharacterized membrane protein (UPF0136 family)